MSLVELKVNDFINEVDSNSPAPGGGSVSALASSLGLSLSKMVGHLTFGKKKYEALDENIRNEFEENFNKLAVIKNEIVSLIDKDTEAFNEIMAAFKLPKATDEEKTARKDAIEKATLGAIEVPYSIAKHSLEALEQLDTILEHGNKNAASDIGVGALLLDAGLQGAILNVKINLPGISDENIVNDYTNKCKEMLEKSKSIKDQIIEKVNNVI